jgi:hypothetical protein
MKRKIYVLILLVMSVPTYLFAQVSAGGTPDSWNNLKIPLLTSKEVMSVVDVASLKAEDAIDAQYKDLPFRFAYGHDVNFTPDNSGSWFEMPNGNRIWRLKIKSKGALSMNVTFASYHIPVGAKLFIYSSDEVYKIGAFTSFNNKESGYLGTSAIPGDEIIIEYNEPANVSFEGELVIETVAHAYRNVFKIAKEVSQNKWFGDSGNCNNNVVCPEAEDWSDQIRSVAMITLGNGTRWCSGSLLNNVLGDGTPYFLTANHCISGQNVSTWVFYFNYDSDICDEGGDGNDGVLTQSVSGSSLLENTNTPGGGNSTNSMDTDMALLLLDETPPEDYNVFYSGWDWSGVAPATAVGIHHPSGDVKKISWDTDETGISGYLDVNGTGGGTTHWHINDWEDGTTEGGSSGSPLFNDSYQVIGQLHGGYANCSNNVDDYYGRLALSFQYIQEWLDPDSTGVTSINGYPDAVILGTDPGLPPIQGIEDTYCNVTTISPTIILKNYGASEITGVSIDYFLDGNLEGTYNWTGSLQNGESDDIAIGEINIRESGNHVFSAEFDYDRDENLLNNVKDFEFYAIVGGVTLDVSILTDDYGTETTWGVYSMSGIQLASGGIYTDEPILYEEEVCIPDTCVIFTIYDSAGDGICCGYGQGAYTVSYNGVEVAAGGEFVSEESTTICTNLIDAITEENPLDRVLIYPNPATDKLVLSLGSESFNNIDIQISNLLGQRVYNQKYSTLVGLETIDVQDLPRGVYILELSNASFNKSIKVVLE